MTMFGRALRAAPLVGALLLAGCGGGTTSAGDHSEQAGQGVAVGEPNGGAPVTASFIKMAQDSNCSDVKNRLFVIDGKQVFWDRAGKCADNSYAQSLFGPTPEAVLCSVSDSIAGPRTFCADEKSRALFDKVQKNLDKPDLGLGTGHKVEALAFLPKSGAAIAFESVTRETFSGVTAARTVVIKDAAAWEKLWAEHAGNRIPAPELPQVDFRRKMLVGVFSGEHGSGCHTTAIVRVGSKDGKIVVDFVERDQATIAICPAVVSHPMHMVAVDRHDAAVEFVAARDGAPGFTTIDLATRSNVAQARTVVVKDDAAWAALWAQHAGAGAALPRVDFSTTMVIGVFMGTQANGCYSTSIGNITKTAGNTLSVLHRDTVPAMGVACTLNMTAPAHLVQVERSDSPVEFATEVVTVK
jgi:hypothetical protein